MTEKRQGSERRITIIRTIGELQDRPMRRNGAERRVSPAVGTHALSMLAEAQARIAELERDNESLRLNSIRLIKDAVLEHNDAQARIADLEDEIRALRRGERFVAARDDALEEAAKVCEKAGRMYGPRYPVQLNVAMDCALGIRAMKSEAQPVQARGCPVSFQHLPHDTCDGSPAEPVQAGMRARDIHAGMGDTPIADQLSGMGRMEKNDARYVKIILEVAALERRLRAATPAGWKLMPETPTQEMLEAAEAHSHEWFKSTTLPMQPLTRDTWQRACIARYRAMYAAAPDAAGKPDEGGND